MADRAEHVLELAALGPGVMDVVRDDTGQAELVGQARGLGDEPVVLGQEVVLKLEDEAGRDRATAPGSSPAAIRVMAVCAASAKQAGVAFGDQPGPSSIAHPQPPGEFAVATSGQRDEALGVVGQKGLAEPRHALRAGQVGPADQAAQTPVAGGVPSQQDEVRSARAVADPPEILLDWFAPAGQPSPFRTRPNGHALDRSGRRVVDQGRPTTGCGSQLLPRWALTAARTTNWTAAGATSRDDDSAGIGDERVEQLDLDPQDRLEPRLTRRRGETHDSIQPVVIGDGQAAEADRQGTFDQLVGGRCAVQEREVGVTVELGVCHGQWSNICSILSTGRPAKVGPQSPTASTKHFDRFRRLECRPDRMRAWGFATALGGDRPVSRTADRLCRSSTRTEPTRPRRQRATGPRTLSGGRPIRHFRGVGRVGPARRAGRGRWPVLPGTVVAGVRRGEWPVLPGTVVAGVRRGEWPG